MDDKKQGSQFVKQAMILALASFLSRLLGFIYRMPLTNKIGDEGNAYYGKAYTVYTFILIFSSAGLPSAISKLVSERISLGRRDEAHRVFKAALAVSAAFGAVCMAALFFGARAFSVFMDSPNSYYSLLALAPTVFIVAVMSAFRGYFQGLGTSVPTSVSQVVEQGFNAVFSIVLASLFMDMVSENPIALGAAGGSAGTGVGAVFGIFTVVAFYFMQKREIDYAVNRSRQANIRKARAGFGSLAAEILKTSMPIIAGTAVLTITNLIDSSMMTDRLLAGGLSIERADELFGQLTGKYSTIITLPLSISAVFATASMPSISSSNVLMNARAVEYKINTALRLTMMICVPAAAGLAILGDPIVRLLFRDYPEGGILIQIGAVNIIFMALNQILTGPLQATGNVVIPIIAAGAGAAVKIISNFILVPIPEINIIGAVISTLLCYVTASAINWRMLKIRTGARLNFRSLMLKPLFSSVIMGAVCFIVYNCTLIAGAGNGLAAVAAIGMGFVVYLMLMFISGGITADDVRLMPFGARAAEFLRRNGFVR
ncbi:MAG: polysaccharide biosynthesis protein [Clostridiales bacterium]|jgi:stage V sporulation protein B|nr:polysaccharide biosynthesis protein [Clostridiales bacterium]